MYYCAWQSLWTIFALLNPFFLKLMVQYLIDGKNAVEKYDIKFIDFSKSEDPFLKSFAEGRQYAIVLCLVFLVLQTFNKIVKRKIDVDVSYLGERAASGV